MQSTNFSITVSIQMCNFSMNAALFRCFAGCSPAFCAVLRGQAKGETPQTMRSIFRLALSADLPLFQLLTAFSRCFVCAAFQPLHQFIFHHQFTPADPQSWEVRAAQKVICPRFGNLQRFGKPLCIHHIGHGFKRFSAHRISFPAETAAATISVTAAVSASVYLSKYF